MATTRTRTSRTKQQDQRTFKRVQFGRYDARVVGLQHCNGHRYWADLAVGSTVYLERQPDNVHDKNAVTVSVWDGADYVRVGFIEKNVAMHLSKEMDRGFEVEAIIIRRNESADPYNQVTANVALYAYLPE